jgi:UDP-glucose 4-epimerase
MASEARAALVTGATGFLGRRLCQRLKDLGEPVVAVGRRAEDGPWDQFLELDLAEQSVPVEVLAATGTIYQLAGKATGQLLEAARAAGVRRFIYFSSAEAMGEGNPPGLPLKAIDEGWPHTPQCPSGMAKAEAERRVRESGLAHAVILRPTMVFGPGANGSLSRMVEAVRRGRFPPLPETGNRRSMIHVDDVVEFAIRAAQRPLAAGRTYILTGPDAPSTRQLYDAIRASLSLPPLEWSIPLWLLRLAAAAGTLLGGLLGRRLPLELQAPRKLTGSAWYAGLRAERELDYTARHGVTDWLKDGS